MLYSCFHCGTLTTPKKSPQPGQPIIWTRTLLGGIMRPSCSFECAQVVRTKARMELGRANFGRKL